MLRELTDKHAYFDVGFQGNQTLAMTTRVEVCVLRSLDGGRKRFSILSGDVQYVVSGDDSSCFMTFVHAACPRAS